MKHRLNALLIALGIVAVISLVWQLWPTTTHDLILANLDRDEAVGMMIGKLVHETIPGDGDVAIIQLPAINATEHTRAARQRAALEKGLGHTASRLVLLSPEQMSVPERGALATAANAGVWGEQFRRWADSGKKARVIISLMGLPQDMDADALQTLPPVVAFGHPGTIPLDEWLTTRHVRAWVAPRGNFAGATPAGKSPDQIFDTYFEVHVQRPAGSEQQPNAAGLLRATS